MSNSKNILSKWLVILVFALLLIMTICISCLLPSGIFVENYANKVTAWSDQVQAEKAGVSDSTLYGTYALSAALDPSFNTRSETTYDMNNYDVLYHTDPESIEKSDMHSPLNGTWVNQEGKAVFVPWKTEANYVTYYNGGAYPYGGTSYVPTYEESVYLSKTTGQSTVANSYNKADIMSGFCSQQSAASVEQNCAALTANQCASTSCCVLLGGSKCVGGDEKGPTLVSNYSDRQIHNKDFYYYQGKCYGNCDNTNHSGTPYPRKPIG
jgi:hypothetical protein